MDFVPQAAENRNLGVVCLEFKPFQRNTLRGFAQISVPSWHMTISGIAIHEKEGRRWAALPARPYLDNSGELVREDDGKPRYVKVFQFDNRDVGDRFSAAVLKAVDLYHGGKLN
jgi:hypothetical protein